MDDISFKLGATAILEVIHLHGDDPVELLVLDVVGERKVGDEGGAAFLFISAIHMNVVPGSNCRSTEY